MFTYFLEALIRLLACLLTAFLQNYFKYGYLSVQRCDSFIHSCYKLLLYYYTIRIFKFEGHAVQDSEKRYYFYQYWYCSLE